MIEESSTTRRQLVTGCMDYAIRSRDRLPPLRASTARHAPAGQPAGCQGVGEGLAAWAPHPASWPQRLTALSEFGVKHIDMMLRPGEAVAHHPRRSGVIPSAFEYQRAASIDERSRSCRIPAASCSPVFTASGFDEASAQ